MTHVNEPYGETLINLLENPDRVRELNELGKTIPSHTLTHRQICDLELLLNGGLSPLRGFMLREEYESVLEEMRLDDGKLWPVPITLDVPDALAAQVEPGGELALRDSEGFMVAVLRVESRWKADREKEAKLLFGTDSRDHPGVRYLLEEVNDTYIGGRVEGIQLPLHYDFETLRHTPAELRAEFERLGWRRVVAFHTSKPMHRIHREITLKAAREANAHILIHPAVGMTKPGDLHYYARVHCYEAILRHYPHNLAVLSLLPVAVRMAGPREALMNAIIRKNYGCSHIIIGPEHAAPPNLRDGEKRFYPAYASQEIVRKHMEEIGIEMIPVREMRYVPETGTFLPLTRIEREGKTGLVFTDKRLREDLACNRKIPDWFSYPDVIERLRTVYPRRSKQGLTLFFTGLSGAGKSTLAKILYAKFIEAGGRPVTLLDGDIVRRNLSSELGFSKAHRDLNIQRIGFVAGEITKNGGVAICAPIAPYSAMRRAVRELIEQHGAFIEIHVATPVEVCEGRDRKGLYAKARAGLIPAFTGVSDPYEVPETPEIRIDTTDTSPMEAAQEVFLYLIREGYIDTEG
ncbi:MAG: bifunctional sulfate adenylyltransferase/adenylylsulfate kinase [Deltaproteobacteria bacterium]|nr:bifunctional sulfate adenylyltransferase/adenylylsulfate kinase [Deltaproteobacteria bacterium]